MMFDGLINFPTKPKLIYHECPDVPGGASYVTVHDAVVASVMFTYPPTMIMYP